MKLTLALFTTLLLLRPSATMAQDQPRTPFAATVIKQVLIDPTTYAPAVVAWEATRLDWQSSQIFFQNGSVEHNARFTTSGLDNSAAMAYGVGNRQIFMDAVTNLEISMANNVSMRVIERLLVSRYPTHHKLLRTVGWVERIGMSSLWAYEQSSSHFRQWQDNVQSARELGLK